jgi:hypothetical protein
MTQDEYNKLFHKAQLNRVAFKMVNDCDAEILALVNAAIEEERNACAALCFQMWNMWMDSEDKSEFMRPDAEDCAAAIRARGQV